MQRRHFLIRGERTPALGSEQIDVVSPMTQEVIGSVPLGTPADISAAVDAARTAFDRGPWPRMAVDERKAVLARAGAILEAGVKELGDLVTAENGTLRSHGYQASIPDFAYHCGLNVPDPVERTSFTGARALITREPVGVVAGIVPWNSPLRLNLSKVLPALLAGCTLVLKPAPETPLDAYVLVEAFHEAGLPPGVLNVVVADREVSEELVRHPGVDLVSFTGSTAAGRRIGAICGERLRRVHLELGGKSAAIVLDDADLTTAVPSVLRGGMLFNNGQACAAWTRILVPAARHDEIVAAMCDHITTITIGDPFDVTTDLGPLVAERQRARVEGYVSLAKSEGASVAIGGGRPAGLDRGWFIEPTLIVGATNEMRSSREEIFGPVASVIPYADVDDAVRLANDSDFGLSGAVWTEDARRGIEVAKRIRTGTIGVNNLGCDIAFPFGGYKDSGLGRQFGPEGIDEFLEIKTIGLCGPRLS